MNALRNLWQPVKNRILLQPAISNAFWKIGWVVAALIATAEIGGFLYMTRSLPPEFIRETIKLTKALSILPVTFMVGAFLLDWGWARLPQPGRWKRFLEGQQSLLVLLGIGPFLILAVLAQFRPILNQRGLLFASPYLLLLLSIGLVRLRAVWIAALVPVLTVMCVASTVSYRGMMVDPADYAQFASGLQAEIRPGDLVFIQKAWYTTPIFFYLHPARYRLVGRNYADSCLANPEARVWVVLLYDPAPTKEMEAALSGYQPVKTVTAPRAKAILYQH